VSTRDLILVELVVLGVLAGWQAGTWALLKSVLAGSKSIGG
jgi:hypothetical protein